MMIWLRLYFWEDRGQRLSRNLFQIENGDGLFYEITYHSVIFLYILNKIKYEKIF